MRIDSIELEGFRNYESARAEFIPGVNVIIGDNAEGKTNLLESIYILAAGRSFRAKSDKELIGFSKTEARIPSPFVSVSMPAAAGFLLGMGFLLSCRNFYKNRRLMLRLLESLAENPAFEEKKQLKEIRRVFRNKIRIGRLLAFMTVRRWAILTQWCYGLCRNDRSEYVSVPGGRNHYFGEMYRRDCFVESVPMEYEGHMWNVPRDYDAYLRNMYGDYRKLPAPEEREEHVILELQFPENQANSGDKKTQEE